MTDKTLEWAIAQIEAAYATALAGRRLYGAKPNNPANHEMWLMRNATQSSYAHALEILKQINA